MPLEIVVGDITKRTDDAIVNSANRSLLAGGGVSGAIHRAAGPELELACKRLGGCAVGEAVITPGFNLPARHAIHAVGPQWMGGDRGEPALLRKCHISIFELAQQHGLKSVALPAISIGIYRFPVGQAAEIAIDVSRVYSDGGLTITLVLFDEDTAEIYRDTPGAT